MTATSTSNGHPISFIDDIWIFDDNGQKVKDGRPCFNCGRAQTSVTLQNGETIKVDACIENQIKLLNNNGVKTKSSCCGHGQHDSFII